MNRYLVLFSFLLGGWFVESVLPPLDAAPQAGNGLLDESPISHEMIGEPCTVFLKNGEGQYGTLWEVGADFLILKIKKGPLYSKEEKFAFSEIDYVEDVNRRRVNLQSAQVSPQPEPNTTAGGETGVMIRTFNPSEETTPEEDGNLDELLKKLDDDQPAREEESEVPLIGLEEDLNLDPSAGETSKPADGEPGLLIVTRKQSSETASSEEAQPSVENPKPTQTSQPSPQPRNQAPAPSRKSATPQTPESEVESSEDPGIRPGPVVPAVGLAESRQVKIIRYQVLILFGASVLAALLMIVLKIKGMAGYAYGKRSLFPTQLVKIDGEYGVIDQGAQDGVKVDDEVKFYRKSGRRIRYVGKMNVVKVGETHAAVQLVTISRHGPMKAGDVGMRDRNLIFTATVIVRKITGTAFWIMARIFEFVSKVLAVKSPEPELEVQVVDEPGTKRKRPPQPRPTDEPELHILADDDVALDLEDELTEAEEPAAAAEPSEPPVDQIEEEAPPELKEAFPKSEFPIFGDIFADTFADEPEERRDQEVVKSEDPKQEAHEIPAESESRDPNRESRPKKLRNRRRKPTQDAYGGPDDSILMGFGEDEA